MNRLMKVGREFRRWQGKHGRGTGYHVPVGMKERAVELLGEYSDDEITKALRLGLGTLRNWRDRMRSGQKEKRELEFVEVKSAPPVLPVPTIEWERGDGCRLRLSGCRSEELSKFITEFLSRREGL